MQVFKYLTGEPIPYLGFSFSDYVSHFLWKKIENQVEPIHTIKLTSNLTRSFDISNENEKNEKKKKQT